MTRSFAVLLVHGPTDYHAPCLAFPRMRPDGQALKAIYHLRNDGVFGTNIHGPKKGFGCPDGIASVSNGIADVSSGSGPKALRRVSFAWRHTDGQIDREVCRDT